MVPHVPIPLNMTKCRCIYGCDHKRHEPYHNKFTINEGWFERQYYWNVATYVTDTNISFSDPDDLELFQDAVFESPWGRIHINFYEQLFKNYYQYQPDWVLRTFARYLEFLEHISPLFTEDAFAFIFKKNDVKLIENLLKILPFRIKLRMIKSSEKYPEIMRAVPKLKLYNLFS